MQHIPPSDSSSYYPRGYLNRPENNSYPNDMTFCGDPGMLLSSSRNVTYERSRTPSNQNMFSLASAPSSMYGSTSGYDITNPSEAIPSPFIGQMDIGNQFDFLSNYRTRDAPPMSLGVSTNLQHSFNENVAQNVSPRELGNSTRYEDNSASFSPPRRSPRLYTCDICEKKFVRPSSLTTHRFSHTGEKPHSCPTCGKSFSVASNLRRHEMTIHGPRVSTSGGAAYEGLNPTTSGGLQSASLVGSTSSSVIYQRGSETYENILPSHERFYDIYRSSQR
ncbi:uncharacterized protein PGTG_19491 [Puccinia graminis f. sp. tritici CRL 75-36-700-3]|uniref:C2H2-type domain-containing protein n=1 Tax=Puccinia graminis f. sp. tritici (strain CRL 75-36-700-3 / race SCCL) TaxID=418459 RepID=E3LA39_PUCGT|nr:uncharacterized protein PGTG_19491 [Puccinia graminis f. sp. tritici CRL 75-36-700-3]EFP93414.2 hypothetical protein PGTG_19491 [Puccinia graminis f. sp. tritici CRL 75-36-700-3]